MARPSGPSPAREGGGRIRTGLPGCGAAEIECDDAGRIAAVRLTAV
ncbi:hypothetical protein [Streptomyces erythrochromogenes]